MKRVGLTGGIASGKSEVSSLFDQWGAIVVDHDILARQAVEKGSIGLERLVQHFGEHILTKEGELDRPLLGSIVFENPKELKFLNSVVHPEVKRLAARADRKYADTNTLVVHDIPLLVETTQAPNFEAVIVVEAPLDQRIERMEHYRSMSYDSAVARIKAQATDEQRRSIATHIIINSGSLAQLEEAAREVWTTLTSDMQDLAR